MIAGNQADPLGRRKAFQPRTGRAAFPGETELGQVSGDREVIDPLPIKVGNETRQHVRIVDEAAPATP